MSEDETDFKQHPVRCPYCREKAKKVQGDYVYPHRYDLRNAWFYVCDTCDARVGCHKQSGKPFGRLANKELREIRRSAHAVFDPIWRKGNKSRHEAYLWLAERMEIPSDHCHIGWMDVGLCKQVILICKSIPDGDLV